MLLDKCYNYNQTMRLERIFAPPHYPIVPGNGSAFNVFGLCKHLRIREASNNFLL